MNYIHLIILILVVLFILLFVVFMYLKYCVFNKKRYWNNRLKKAHNDLYYMLPIVQCILSKYNITYLAIDGTLLAAVRHSDFIPWDDDMDFCILNNREWGDNRENIKRDMREKGLIPNESDNDFIQVTADGFNCHIDLFPFDRKTREDGKIVWESSNKWFNSMWPNSYYYEDEIFPIVYRRIRDCNVRTPNKSVQVLKRAFGKDCIEVGMFTPYHSMGETESRFFKFILSGVKMEV